jgi:hypothetical protein
MILEKSWKNEKISSTNVKTKFWVVEEEDNFLIAVNHGDAKSRIRFIFKAS